jgi:hypothetical protein
MLSLEITPDTELYVKFGVDAITSASPKGTANKITVLQGQYNDYDENEDEEEDEEEKDDDDEHEDDEHNDDNDNKHEDEQNNDSKRKNDGREDNEEDNVDAITSASPVANKKKRIDEYRREGYIGITHRINETTYSGRVGYSTENDYRSLYYSLSVTHEFNNRNTAVSLGYSNFNDTIMPLNMGMEK